MASSSANENAPNEAKQEVKFHGVLTTAEETQMIRDCAAHMEIFGVDISKWRPKDVLRCGISEQKLQKLAKAFSSLTDPEQIDALFTEALAIRICPPPHRMTVQGFIDLCTWVRGPAGTKFLQSVQHTQRLQKKQKKALSGRTPADMALSQILDLQMTEYAAHKTKIREETNTRLAELRREMRAVEKKLEKRLGRAVGKFEPASNFVEPAVCELGKRSRALYKEQCRATNVKPVEHNSSGVDLAVKMFGTQVRSEKAASFCSQDGVREALLAYHKKRILELDTRGEFREATRSRNLLAAALQ